jgi:hypothetical protein
MKNPEARIFDEAGPEDSANALALLLSNSEAETEAIIAKADRYLSAAGNSLEGLEAHAGGGHQLIDLKSHVGHGNFEQIVEARLGIKRQRRAQLMKLARKWPHILTAIEWAKAANRLTRSDYSVDGALALLKAWQHRDDPDAQCRPGHRRAEAKQTICDDSSVSNGTGFILFLLEQLAVARQRIAFLESEIERLSGSPYADVPPDQFALPLLEHTE